MNNWDLNEIDQQLIDLALQEDLGIVFKDATTELLFGDEEITPTACLISKHSTPLVLCGLVLIKDLFSNLQADYHLETHYQDGDLIQPGEKILTLTCEAKSLLMLERTLLNFVRHLSAVATETRAFVEKVKLTQLKILDTRKTTPGWRHLEKYAVHCGGGINHRLGLYDAIMVKDTHIDFLGGIKPALAKLPLKSENNLPVIVEVRNMTELKEVIAHGKDKVNRVLLDNMSPEQLTKCVALCEDIFSTEASGNLNLDNILAVAESGVEFASVGMITHSAKQVDISMQINQTHEQ